MFHSLRLRAVPQKPSAIVVVSGHWIASDVRVSSAEYLVPAEEGFPPEFRSTYSPKGHVVLASNIAERLQNEGVAASLDGGATLDHGALIPLKLMFPEADVPIVQLSLQQNLNPEYHANIARILTPLLAENILFIGSGGLVHNRHEIVRFGGSELQPDEWASDFEALVDSTLLHSVSHANYAESLSALYKHKTFAQAHPTSEHFLPFVFVSVMGKKYEKLHTGFQWKNLSMAAYRFGE